VRRQRAIKHGDHGPLMRTEPTPAGPNRPVPDLGPLHSRFGRGSDQPARLGIVGRHRLFADSLRVALEGHGMEVVVTSGPAEAADVVGRDRPDLVLIDLDGNREGTELGRVLLERHADLKVAGITGAHDERALRESVRAGFHAYVTKESSVAALVAALRRALAGRMVRPPRGSRRRVMRWRAVPQPALTARELQVMELLVMGEGNRVIARRMSISPHTVRTHIQSILTKLQVHTRLEAVAWARRNSLVTARASLAWPAADGSP
jgi:two-component system nitrate/nitrite response regulator NarL